MLAPSYSKRRRLVYTKGMDFDCEQRPLVVVYGPRDRFNTLDYTAGRGSLLNTPEGRCWLNLSLGKET